MSETHAQFTRRVRAERKARTEAARASLASYYADSAAASVAADYAAGRYVTVSIDAAGNRTVTNGPGL